MAREVVWHPPAHTGVEPLVLTDQAAGLRIEKGSRGLGLVQFETVQDDSPWSDGSTVEDVYALPRQPMLPMMVWGADRAEFLSRLRTLSAALVPRDGGGRAVPGELELAQHDGRRFRLQAHYLGGLPDEETTDLGGDTNWCRFQLQLLAPDPFWYAPEPTVLSWTFADPVPFLGNPFLPLRISPSQTIGDVAILNPGTAPALGMWRITGPGNNVVLANLDSGEQIQITGTIPDGEQLVVVTDPLAPSITLQPSGVDWWDKVADGPVLWAIPPGTTSASLTLSGAASGSRVVLEFRPRFGAPW